MAANYESSHEKPHYINCASWLRAAVLGANDGVVSVSSLIVELAAGEYVSVSSQADVEKADIARAKVALFEMPTEEEAERASIYQSRGLSRETAELVAREITEPDANVRDELGLSEVHSANPLHAAFASGVAFTVSVALPLLAAVLPPGTAIIPVVVVVKLVGLAGLGALGAVAGGAPILTATARVLFWGAAAMAITAGVGRMFRVAV